MTRVGGDCHAVPMGLDFAKFNDQVLTEPNLFTMFLKGHLWVEHAMDDALSILLPRPKALGDRMQFSQKMRLCNALGFTSPDIMTGIKAMNDQRNDLAHKLDFTLTPEGLVESAARLRNFVAIGDKPLNPREDPKGWQAMWFFAVVTAIAINAREQQQRTTIAEKSGSANSSIEDCWDFTTVATLPTTGP